MGKIPVFDFGDTLVPCFRLQNQLVNDVFREYGFEEVPEFDVNNFRIYTPSEVKGYMDEHGLSGADPVNLIEKYKDRERRFMEENDVFRFLRNCSEEFGEIGIVSDNTLEGKKWMENQFSAHNVPYRNITVSEEVGVEKPDPKIFRRFLKLREEPAKKFVYFGNNARRDTAAEKVGMDFVWVTQYNTFGTSYEGKKVEEMNLENVRRFCDVDTG